MIKTLIATGLITANIMGAVYTKMQSFSQQWQSTYTWTKTTVNNNAYRYGYKSTETYETPVIRIQNKSFIEHGNIVNMSSLSITIYTYTKITALINDVLSNNTFGYTGIDYSNYFANNWDVSIYQYQLYTAPRTQTLDNAFNQISNDRTIWTTFINPAYSPDNTWTDKNSASNEDALYYYANDQVEDIYIGTTAQPMYIITKLSLLINANGNYMDMNNEIFVNAPQETTGYYEWTTNTEEAHYDVIDVGDLLMTILAMPFAWISTAFNFTFWEGTAYALNVGHILAGLIIAGLVIIIIKKVYK